MALDGGVPKFKVRVRKQPVLFVWFTGLSSTGLLIYQLLQVSFYVGLSVGLWQDRWVLPGFYGDLNGYALSSHAVRRDIDRTECAGSRHLLYKGTASRVHSI